MERKWNISDSSNNKMSPCSWWYFVIFRDISWQCSFWAGCLIVVRWQLYSKSLGELWMKSPSCYYHGHANVTLFSEDEYQNNTRKNPLSWCKVTDIWGSSFLLLPWRLPMLLLLLRTTTRMTLTWSHCPEARLQILTDPTQSVTLDSVNYFPRLAVLQILRSDNGVWNIQTSQ